MASSHSSRKGKSLLCCAVILTSLLLVSDFSVFPRFSCLVLASEPDPSPISNSVTETDAKNHNPFEKKNVLECEKGNSPDLVLLREQQNQLEKLQDLVKNLTQLVSRLESKILDSELDVKALPLSPSSEEIRDVEKIREDDVLTSRKEVVPGEGAVLVTKYNTFWSERFEYVSAVKLGSNPTCVNVLPFRDFEGLSKYSAVGDDKGRLYVFSRRRDVLLEFDTFSDSNEPSSPITAIVSYLSLHKNETMTEAMVAVGHENGVIVMLRILESKNGEEWSSLHVDGIRSFEIPESPLSRINILEVHHAGWRRHVLAIDGSGRIAVFREDGILHGDVTPSRRPIAFLKQRLLFLSETGAGSLDLRTMKLREMECEGLNSSCAKGYVFDPMDRSKAYGFTSEGDLIHTFLLGDVMNFKCRVRSKRKMEINVPLTLQAIKGYLLIANDEKVLVYNVSSQHYVRAGGLRLLFSAGLDEILASFPRQQAAVDATTNEKRTLTVPLITSDGEKHVVLSLGNGYVAMYRSNLAVFKNEFNSLLWTSPVLFFILFLFGAWHFFANKKDALTSWGPDDPFSSTSVASSAPLGSSSGAAVDNRSFTDSSRNSEIMEIRGGGLRSSSRYVSPPRFPGGTGNSYRPNQDTDSRSAPFDPRFRATSELKFRGSNVESLGGQKRRDTVFVNSQVVDDNN